MRASSILAKRGGQTVGVFIICFCALHPEDFCQDMYDFLIKLIYHLAVLLLLMLCALHHKKRYFPYLASSLFSRSFPQGWTKHRFRAKEGIMKPFHSTNVALYKYQTPDTLRDFSLEDHFTFIHSTYLSSKSLGPHELIWINVTVW